MDCKQVGWAVQRLGAGRAKPGDPVSAHAGIEMHAKLGDKLEANQPLVTLFAEDVKLLDEPEAMLRETLQIKAAPPKLQPLVREVITSTTRKDPETKSPDPVLLPLEHGTTS
jgi:pyrimidine-nucleoside phosphorylase